jgi:hypothetical protein
MQQVGKSGSSKPAFIRWTRPAPGKREVAEGLVVADTASRFAAYATDRLILFVVILAASIPFIQAPPPVTFAPAPAIASPIVIAGRLAAVLIEALYFIAFWSGGRRATPGQRLSRIEVGNAFDGASLTVGQATRRWLGFGLWLTLVNLVTALNTISAVAFPLWTVALLWTTVNSPTKQGLHDRFANTLLVRPEAAPRGTWLLLFTILAWVTVAVGWLGTIAAS